MVEALRPLSSLPIARRYVPHEMTERAAQWDRNGRTDEEIRKAYEENMAAKKTKS